MPKSTGSVHQPAGASSAKRSSSRPWPAPPMNIERITDQSAIRPASQVPATMPRPKASRKTGATASDSPPTSVIVGTM